MAKSERGRMALFGFAAKECRPMIGWLKERLVDQGWQPYLRYFYRAPRYCRQTRNITPKILRLENRFRNLYYSYRCMQRRTNRGVLLLTGLPGVREIWRNFTEQEKRDLQATSPGTNKRDTYEDAISLFDKHFALKIKYTFFCRVSPRLYRRILFE